MSKIRVVVIICGLTMVLFVLHWKRQELLEMLPKSPETLAQKFTSNNHSIQVSDVNADHLKIFQQVSRERNVEFLRKTGKFSTFTDDFKVLMFHFT